MTELQKLEAIPFHGGTLIAAEMDGKVYTSIRHVCRSIGLHYSTQLQKLKRKSWAGVFEMNTPDERGRDQEHAMIDVDALPMWMATLHEGKVDPSCREWIVKFQHEAKEVLAKHFLRQPKQEVVPSEEYIEDADCEVLMRLFKTRQEVLKIQRQQEQQWQEIKKAELLALEADCKATKAINTATAVEEAVYNTSGHVSAMGYARSHSLNIPLPQLAVLGKKATAVCGERGIQISRVNDPRFGFVNIYPTSVLEELHQEFVSRAV